MVREYCLGADLHSGRISTVQAPLTRSPPRISWTDLSASEPHGQFLEWSGYYPESPVLCERETGSPPSSSPEKTFPLWELMSLWMNNRPLPDTITDAGAPLLLRDCFQALRDSVLEQAGRVQHYQAPLSTTFCIPNGADEDRQEALARWMMQPGQPVHFLWRPVAAALGMNDWHRDLRPNSSPIPPPGYWCVDLEWNSFEISWIGIRGDETRERRFPVPQRDLPDDSNHIYKEISPIPEAAAKQLLEGAGLPSQKPLTRSAALTWLHCADSPGEPQRHWLKDGNGWRRFPIPPERFRQSLLASVQKTFSTGNLHSKGTGFHERLEQMAGRISNSDSPVILCGALADALRKIRNRPDQIWRLCFPHYRPPPALYHTPGAVAGGAAVFGGFLAKEQTAYFDTLPAFDIRVVEPRLGLKPEIRFHPLIERQAVAGGSEWKTPYPIQGFQLRRGSREFSITLRRENETNLRTIPTQLPNPVTGDVDVGITASMRPGAGQARIEVHPPPHRNIFAPRKHLVLDWDRMKVTSEEEVHTGTVDVFGYPLIARRTDSSSLPVLLPKLAELELYKNPENLERLLLKGSDSVFGSSPPAQPDKGLRMIRKSFQTVFETLKDAPRQKGYSSTYCKYLRLAGFYRQYTTPNFRRWLGARIARSPDNDTELRAAGRCFSSGAELDILIQALRWPMEPHARSWLWWALFRSLSEYPQTVQVPDASAILFFKAVLHTLMSAAGGSMAGQPSTEHTKHCLCAYLYGLRFREVHTGFAAGENQTIDDINRTLQRMPLQLPIPPTMLPKTFQGQHKTFNLLALTFGQGKADEKDLELLQGISLSL